MGNLDAKASNHPPHLPSLGFHVEATPAVLQKHGAPLYKGRPSSQPSFLLSLTSRSSCLAASWMDPAHPSHTSAFSLDIASHGESSLTLQIWAMYYSWVLIAPQISCNITFHIAFIIARLLVCTFNWIPSKWGKDYFLHHSFWIFWS